LRTIKTGYLSNTFVEVLEGLKAGDLVIVDQLDKFRDGDRVRTDLVGSK
jgi:multidrug efflux pump subunit AcrA (membrane-fusion protein)